MTRLTRHVIQLPSIVPTFLWHTHEDKGVPSENRAFFYLALRKAGVPAELHIFEKGRHGIGLAKDIPGMNDWPQRCQEWMQTRVRRPTHLPAEHDKAPH